MIIKPIMKKSKKEDDELYNEVKNTDLIFDGNDMFIIPKLKMEEDMNETINEKKIS